MEMAYHKIEVIYRTDPGGQRTPEQFLWGGQRYRVFSIGRRWRGERGEHVLVQAAGEVYELLFDEQDLTWWVKPPAGPRMV